MRNLGIQFLFILLAGLTPFKIAHAEMVNKVVAVVNEQPIMLYDLDKAMAQDATKIMGEPTQAGQETALKKSRSGALKALVEEALLDQELKKKNITITKADEEKAINNVLERNKMTLDQLKKEIQSKGVSWNSYVISVKEQLKKIKFMGQVLAPRVKVTDKDLDEFFAANTAQFSKFQSVEMAQVIIPAPSGSSDAQLEQAKQIAEQVAKKARGGSNFEELGRKYSQNPITATKDTYPVAQLSPAIAAILSELSPGSVSEPVRSTMGWHVIKLYDRKTLAGDEYKAIREQIRGRVFELKLEKEMQDFLDDLKKHAYIEIKS